MKIKAIVLKKINRVVKLEINDTGLNPNNVLVKMKYSGICGSQIAEYLGYRGRDKYLPHLFGHEGTGVVYKVGKKVKDLKIGDKVFLTWIKPTQKKYDNYLYFHKDTKINAGPVTTLSNFTHVSKYCVHKLPKNLGFKAGVLMGCAFPTGYGMVKNFGDIKNKKILIIGLGGVGLSILLSAIYLQPEEIHIVDKNNLRLKEIKNRIKNKNIKIIHNAKINHYDYVFDSTGSVSTLEKSIYFLNNKGKCVFASHPKKNLKFKIDPFELIKGKKIEGSWGGNISYPRDISIIAKIIKLNSKLINLYFKNEYKFNDINKALSDYFKGRSIRPLIKF